MRTLIVNIAFYSSRFLVFHYVNHSQCDSATVSVALSGVRSVIEVFIIKYIYINVTAIIKSDLYRLSKWTTTTITTKTTRTTTNYTNILRFPSYCSVETKTYRMLIKKKAASRVIFLNILLA
jgi:hypothetical protein